MQLFFLQFFVVSTNLVDGIYLTNVDIGCELDCSDWYKKKTNSRKQDSNLGPWSNHDTVASALNHADLLQVHGV